MEFFSSSAPTLQHWLVLTTALFSFGLYGFLSFRNVIRILMSVELMLNAVALNFVVFNYYMTPLATDGQVMSIFIIAIAAAEVVVAMAIFIALFKRRKTLNITEINLMKD